MFEPKIVVIDGCGGGMGKAIVEKLRTSMPQANIIAIGTNPFATQTMMKAGASLAYTGEESIKKFAMEADLIMGVMGILIPNGLKGELTSDMVLAITASKAMKVLVPMNRCGIKVPVDDEPLSVHIDSAVELAIEELNRL
ncbi:MAG: DUF3842 family protein [Eubacteriales bacterium]